LPKVSQAHRDARREEILAATLRAVASKGYSRVAIADVIAESGLSAGAIYAHFDGKQDLFLAVVEEVLGDRRADLEAALDAGPPPSPGDVVALLVHGMIGAIVDVRVLLQIWGEASVEPDVRAVVQVAMAAIKDTLGRALSAWFEAHPDQAPDGLDAAVARQLPVMVSLGMGYVVQSSIVDDFDDVAYLAAVREALPH
jgi:AcrR family transcriptional regulator